MLLIKSTLIFIFLLLLVGCNSPKIRYQFCTKISNHWDCSIEAEFNSMESCKHHKILSASYINFNELTDNGVTTIRYKPSDADIQTNCIQ